MGCLMFKTPLKQMSLYIKAREQAYLEVGCSSLNMFNVYILIRNKHIFKHILNK